ncbi:ABC transporter ATP-binding protein [Halorutilus salinus]|jgi:putative ABC transport system ATP-binding protein|uniref:ABC transporter ATP-binding protein n=1 Tax=Halorutilus salinus TaxID=2487751 RepID=UPI0023EEA134|nr:ABC transporter ATP-binding protein [Halorutilus salinus]
MIARLENVVKRYDSGDETLTVLEGVDFGVERGEFVTVMGPSGCGKTTMLNILGLLDEPSEGTVRLDGDDVTGLDDRERTEARKRFVGFVFQYFYLIPSLTAQENVEAPTVFSGGSGGRAGELLEKVGLGDRKEHKPAELSGGQKQRVAIARALVNSPDVILADEPTGNLDKETGDETLQLIRDLCDEGVGVVAVTHDERIKDYSDRDVELDDGVVL